MRRGGGKWKSRFKKGATAIGSVVAVAAALAAAHEASLHYETISQKEIDRHYLQALAQYHPVNPVIHG